MTTFGPSGHVESILQITFVYLNVLSVPLEAPSRDVDDASPFVVPVDVTKDSMYINIFCADSRTLNVKFESLMMVKHR